MDRVIACDFGNHHSAFAIANLEPFKIIYLRLFVTDKQKDLLEFIEQNIKPYATNTTQIVYENLYMPNKGGYRNFKLMHIQKAVRKYFQDANCNIKALVPSQKAIIGGYSKKDRKTKAENAARQFLAEQHISYFDSETRKHDLADAILMARYIYERK